MTPTDSTFKNKRPTLTNKANIPFYLSSTVFKLDSDIFSVPVMRMMDGFGRNLADQYYKAGSSLEIVCEVL